MTNCEKFDIQTNSWNNVSSLNIAEIGITCLYFHPYQIFICGGYHKNTYETISISPSNVNQKWTVLTVQNATQRGYGIGYQYNEKEILLFGGEYSPSQFIIFDIQSSKLINKGIEFNSNLYNTSKGRMHDGKFKIINYSDKKLYQIDLNTFKFDSSPVDF